MAATDVSDPVPLVGGAVGGESKSARKKKAKAEQEAIANGTPPPAVPDTPLGQEDSLTVDSNKADGESSTDHPYVKELHKQIRNITKKLAGTQKVDSVIAANPTSSLDELVAQRKINTDQKAAAQKKPQLQAQLVQLEEQITNYRKFDADFQTQLSKQKDDLTRQHTSALKKARDEWEVEGTTAGTAELRRNLLVFSQFLRCAAAKRNVEEEADTEESRAFEGALLLVYGGDEKAVDTAMNLVRGSDEQVPSIDGVSLPVTYSQIKQASVEHAPFQTEENWVDSVAEANAATGEIQAAGAPITSDPTLTHAGLTELDTAAQTNGVHPGAPLDSITSPPTGITGDETGNAAGDRWDTTAVETEKLGMEDSFEMVPRPQDELETPASAAPISSQPTQGMNWADEPPAYETSASGNQAGESWDTKAAGDQTEDGWAAETAKNNQAGADTWADGAVDAAPGAVPTEDGDGFQSVAGRHRGRGGRGRGGDGEFRGRGRGRGGFRGDRGDGEGRGRGRGGFRGGRGEGGEFRGRGGGRGRGPRGGAEGLARGS